MIEMTEPKADCEALLHWLMPSAEQTLSRHGEFAPLGGAMRPDGELIAVGGSGVDHDHLVSTDMIGALKDALIASAKAGQCKATAIIYDVSVALPSSGEMSDAIAVSLNHRDNYSVVVMFPYQIANGELQIGQGFAQQGEADIFPTI